VVVTDYLFRASPESSEGVLARRRSELVNATALAAAARGIDLGASLLLGRGEDLTGGRDKTSILADAIEAVFGAVYLDGGIVAATSVVLDLLEPRILEVLGGGVDSDAKSRLQELAAQHGGDLPRYELSETGPEHDKRFDAVVRAGGFVGRGQGRTKKEAEQAAARDVADLLHAAIGQRRDAGDGAVNDDRADGAPMAIDDGTGGTPPPEMGDRRA
jgi:ribonuclease-3